MIVAAVSLTSCRGIGDGFVHSVLYSSLEEAYKAFHETVDLLKRREKRANDLPILVELEGVNKLSLPLEDIRSVSISDYAKQNEEAEGTKEAYPNLKF